MTKKTPPEFKSKNRKPPVRWADVFEKKVLKIGKPVVFETPEEEADDVGGFRKKLYQAILNNYDGVRESIRAGELSLVVRDNVLGEPGTTEVILIHARRE